MHTAPNGKKYIGITGVGVDKRWYSNGRGYHENLHFTNAIKKYGWDNIKHEILADNLSKEEACQLEKILIAQYNTNDPNCGYNKSAGGEFPASGFHHSEETKQKISKIHKGKKHSQEHIEKIRNALTGIKRSEETKKKLRLLRLGKKASDELRQHYSEIRKGSLNPRYGCHLSEETRRKIGEANRGKVISERQKQICKNVRSKPVICVETRIIYPNIQEAANELGVHPSNISDILRGKQKTTRGLHFELYLENENHNIEMAGRK